MAWRWSRLRSGLLLSSVLWVACDLNPQPIAPGALDGAMTPGSGASTSAGSAGTGSGGTAVVASGGTTSTGGSSEIPNYPDAGPGAMDDGDGGGSGAAAGGASAEGGAAGEAAAGGEGG